MIVDALINLLVGVLEWVLSWLPMGVQEGLPECSAENVGQFQWIGAYVNVELVRFSVGFSVTLQGALIVPKIALFVYRLFPFKAS